MASKSSKESGFSLIEVAIALIVISLLMTPLIYAYNVHMETTRFTITSARVDIVKAALLKYFERNGQYPFPANPSVAQGTGASGFGAAIPGPWPICAANATTVCRADNIGAIITPTGTITPAVTNGILIGSVPIAALGLPYKSMLDGYGRKLTYAVSEDLTSTATFMDDRGSLAVRNSAGALSQAHFVVISHGKTGFGAFTLAGLIGIPCGTTTADSENCDNDGLFLSNEDGGEKTVINEGTGTAFFDDKLSHINTTSYGIWSYIPNTGLDMKSKSTGNLKIGCPTVGACEPVAKLDVEGDVKANAVQTGRICDTDTARCVSTWTNPLALVAPRNDDNPIGWFSPTMLTGAPTTPPSLTTYDSTREGFVGSGIRCYSDYALRGINGYDEYCAGQSASPELTATSVVSCDPGEYAKGITITGVNSFRFECVVP